MSLQSQTKNMKKLGVLLNQDLGYIFGEREGGPNGAKKEFFSTGRAFLSALGKDLGFSQQDVRVNKAGIAVSGEIYLHGMWSEDNGLSVVLEQDIMGKDCVLYRTISHIKDRKGGSNNFIALKEFQLGDYSGLLKGFLHFKSSALTMMRDAA